MSPELKDRLIHARKIILRLAANFPGLVDGVLEVNGPELVEWLSNEFHDMGDDWGLQAHAKLGSPLDEYGEVL